MEDGVFAIHEELIKLADATFNIEHAIPLEDLENAEVAESRLNEIVDAVQESPSNVCNPVIFDAMRSFVNQFAVLTPALKTKFMDLLCTALQAQKDATAKDLDQGAADNYPQDRDALSRLGFLFHWLVIVAEPLARDLNISAEKKRGPGAGRVKKVKNDDDWDWVNDRARALELVCKLLALDLNRIWISNTEKESFVNLFTKAIYQMMEDKDGAKTLPGDALDVLCYAVKKYNHKFGAKTSIMLNLKAYDHLSEMMADFIALLALKHEDVSLLEDVLRDIGKMEFNINENDIAGQKSTVPKSFSRFLLRLSERMPKEVMKQMVVLQKHFDAQSYTIRMGMVELVGNLIEALYEDDNDREQADKHIDAFCDILIERFRDTNAFVRGRVLQTVLNIACLAPRREKGEAPRFGIPLAKRPVFVDLIIGRLHDKTSNVRRNAIKTLSVFINNHPYATPQTQRSLNIKKLKSARAEIEQFLKSQQHQLMSKLKEAGVTLFPEDLEKDANAPIRMEDINLDHMDVVLEATASNLQLEEQDAQTRMIPALQLALKWIDDAFQFSNQIQNAMPTLCELLASKTKSEVIEAMEFLVVAQRFDMDCVKDGLRRMVHLIWNKDANSEEGRSVKDTLIESFSRVYLEPEPGNEKEAIPHMVRNLIGLTKEATLADLTSLEQLLSTMMQRGRIPDQVIRHLWATVANTKTEVPKLNRRGSLLILSMLAKTSQDVVAEHLDVLLRIGLGKQGHEDLVLARTACNALQQLGDRKKVKGTLGSASQRWPMTNPVFPQIVELIEAPTTSDSWFPFAEQAINAIYLLAEHPDQICGDMVKRFAARVFGLQVPEEAGVEEVSRNLEHSLRLTSPEPLMSPTSQSEGDVHIVDSMDVARFLFMVGHCAIKQIVHLEAIETEWKRRQALEEAKKKNPKEVAEKGKKDKAQAADEIEQVVGTADDEFGDTIALIRERELLYGNKSLLTLFGPIIAHMCSNNKAFDDPRVQIQATTTLCKMMCVSAEFCEAHLQLLFTILEKSTDPVIRSNIIIALGDMTVSFNSLIDQNIAYLYNRLGDKDLVVKKNTLMVLTHLILNGMVKVKGQISEMAKCLEDENTKIADLAKLFFTELAGKDNAIYNNLPDIISNLSHPDIGIEEEKFSSIMKFLFEFIDKEKQAENIADKLCLRFKNATLPRQWRDISYCLTLLSWKSERSFKRLADNLQYYQDKLHEDTLYKHLQDIVAKVRKIQKLEGKQVLDDYEKKLAELREICVENETAVNAAEAAAQKVSKTEKGDKTVNAATRALSELNLEGTTSKPSSRITSRMATPSVKEEVVKSVRPSPLPTPTVPDTVKKAARPPPRKPVTAARPKRATTVEKENTKRRAVVDSDDDDFF